MSSEQKHLNDESIQRDRRIDTICDAFEKMVLAGERPQIEAFLEGVDGPTKQPLLIELIELEMHFRRSRGETIAIAEYQARFPGLSAARLQATVGMSPAPQPNRGFVQKAVGELQTLDSGSQPDPTSNREFIRYFGDYELLSTIARGGMGVVYKARQISLNRIVALKMILSGEFASKEEVDRFYCEAKAAALLDHPGIVPIFEVGEHQGKHFFSMAYVEGSSLASKLNDGPLDPTQAAHTMLEVAQAVHYAHEKGVIHRDLKPSNILLDLQARPRITDFGLAKRLKEPSGVTVSGQVLGTPSYMPPEQAAGQINTIGPESDVYALGAILYSLTTGRPPFQAASSVETLRQVVEKEPVAPRQLNSAIPRDLETIILKCLEKSLPRRYASANQLADELKRFVDGRPILARPISHVAKLWRLCRRNPAVASLASLILLLLVSVAIISGVAYLREAALLFHQEQLTLSESRAKQQETQAKEQAVAAERIAGQAAKEAELARAEQEKQALIAQQEKEKAKASEALTRRNLYISDAARIAELIKEQNFNRARTLLTRHIPQSTDEEDLRGFDWYYHWRQINQELASYDFKKSVEVMDLSADEKTLAVGCEGGRAYLLDLESGKLQDAVFAIDDEHWAGLAFVGEDRLIGHGRRGGFKLWDRATQENIAYLPDFSKNYYRQGIAYEYRIPAAVGKNSQRMICADGWNALAFWNLKSLRPFSFPFINDGVHREIAQGVCFPFMIVNYGSLNRSINSKGYVVSGASMRKETLTASGAKNWDEWCLWQFRDRAAREYLKPEIGALPQEQAYVVHSGIVAHDGKRDRTIGHAVSAMSISFDGKFMVSGTVTGELQVWGLREFEHPSQWTIDPFKKTKVSEMPIVSVAISGDGKVSLITDGNSWQVFKNDALTLWKKLEVPNGQCTSLTFLDDNLIAVGMSHGAVEVWSLSESKIVQRFSSGQAAVTRIIAGSKSRRIYISNADGKVFAFGRMSEPQPIIPQHTASVEWLQVDRSGVVASLLRLKVPTHGSPVCVNWHQVGKCIRTDVIPRDKSPLLYPLPKPNSWLTPNGIVSNGGQTSTVKFEDEAIALGGKDSMAMLSEDQSCFVKIQANGTLHRWNLNGAGGSATNFVYRYSGSTIFDDFSIFERVALAPDGARIAYSSADSVRWSEQPFDQWHSADLQIAPGAKVTALKWSADNEMIAVGLSDGDVVLHHLSSGRTQLLSRGHVGAIHDLSWMPDKRTLTSAGNDGAIVVWDIEQEEIRLKLVGHQGAVRALAFDAAQGILYSGGDDGRIQPWVAAPLGSVVPNAQQSFVPPVPNAAHQERHAPPSAEALHIRKVIAWLQTRGVTHQLASYGILSPASPGRIDLDQIEELSVHTISLRDNQNLVDHDLAQLEGLSELRVLDLANCKLSPLGLAKLKRLDVLHTLILSGIDLSGFDFENLADLSRIQTLTLNGCSITDEQLMSILRLFPMLRELELSQAQVSNASVSKISAMKLLTTLKLDSTYIDDESLTAIGGLSRLEVLDLSGTKLSGNNLTPISSLKLLKELRLRAIPVTDASMGAFTGLRLLNSLDISNSAVTDEGVRSFLANRPTAELNFSPQLFSKYPELEALLELGPLRGEIDVDGRPLRALDAIAAIQKGGSITGLSWPIDPRRSSEDLPILARLPKLERISLSIGAIPQMHFPILAKISRLQTLELNRAPTSLNSMADVDFVANMGQLKSLRVRVLSDEALIRLQKLQSLESLQCESPDQTIDKLSKAFPRLRELACVKVDAEPLANALPFLDSLESLTLSLPPNKDTWPILAQLKKLKHLNVRISPGASILQLLQQALPGVQVQIKK